MLYPYMCTKCHTEFEVDTSMSEQLEDHSKKCVKCGESSIRVYSTEALHNLNVIADWQPSYNWALGKYIKSRSHQKSVLKDFEARGKKLEEVGNEPPENIHAHFEKARQEKRNARWAKADIETLFL